MGILGKIKSQATNIGSNISDSTSKLSGDIISSSKDNAKLAGLNSEIKSIDGQLEIAYKEIGKSYVDCNLINKNESFESSIADTVNKLAPFLTKKIGLQKECIEIEKSLKDQIVIQEKASAQKTFETEKEKLDKAFNLDVISKEEYDKKLIKIKAPVVNFDEIRRVKKQYELDVISKEEMTEKLAALEA